MTSIIAALRNELVKRGALSPLAEGAVLPVIDRTEIANVVGRILRAASAEDARLTEELIARSTTMLAGHLSSLGAPLDEDTVAARVGQFLLEELPGMSTVTNIGGEMKTAAEGAPENMGPGETKRDFGDYLIPNQNKETGMGAFEVKVWGEEAAEGTRQRDKEHNDQERIRGPFIRMETVSSARAALVSVRGMAMSRLETVASLQGRTEALRAMGAGLPPWLEKKEPAGEGEKPEGDGKPEEAKDEKEPPKEKKPKKLSTEEVLKEALSTLEGIKKDLETLTGASKGIEEQLPPAHLPMPEASKAYTQFVRYAAEGAVADINAKGASIDEVLMKVEHLIAMLEEAVGKKKPEKKEEKVEEGPPMEAEIEGKTVKASTNWFQRLFGIKPKGSSELPPGEAQAKDAKDLLAPNMNKETGMGSYETGQWSEMANRGRKLLDKEHKIDYTQIAERGKIQGIASLKLVINADRKKTAWVVYADVEGVPTPLMESTFQDMVPDEKEQTDANYGVFTDQAPHPSTGEVYSAMIKRKLEKEGLARVRASMHGRWLVKEASVPKAAAEGVGNAPVAGENMSPAYLKAYYRQMFGSDEFASALVKDMKASKAAAAFINDYTLTKKANVELTAKVKALEGNKHQDLRLARATDIARIEASRGLIPWTRAEVIKRATELASLPDAAVDQVQKIAAKLQMVNIRALAEEPPDHETNTTPGAKEMADAAAGIVSDTVVGVTDPGKAVKLEEGTLPDGVEKKFPEDGHAAVNPQDEYEKQTAGISPEMLRKINAAKGEIQKTASQVVPQLTSDGQGAEDPMAKIGEALMARTTVGKLKRAGVNIGSFNKNF